MPPSRSRIREFMFELGIKKNYFDIYQDLFTSITPLPLELFLHELCLIDYFITEEKLSISDFMLYDSYSYKRTPGTGNAAGGIRADSDSAPQTAPASGGSPSSPTVPASDSRSLSREDIPEADLPSPHTTIEFEQYMLSCITRGDVEGLQAYFSSHTAGRPGKTSDNYLRQTKNIFISSVTLCSRAAIEGGLPSEEALSLSDRYIQHSESFDNSEQVMNLQYHMVMDFTSLVAELNQGKRYNKFMRDVTGYIREHLTDRVTVEQMAADLYVSRSYLSSKFKKETGTTISSYITEQKIKKAMEYLKHTDRSILDISTFLGFSSQGYFQNVFKKYTGMTPKAYREQ